MNSTNVNSRQRLTGWKTQFFCIANAFYSSGGHMKC